MVLKFNLLQPQTTAGAAEEEGSTDSGREKSQLRVEEERKEEHARDKGSQAEESIIPVEARSSHATETNTWERSVKEEEKSSHVAEVEVESPQPLPQPKETIHVGKEVKAPLEKESTGAQTQHNSEENEERLPINKSEATNNNELYLGEERGANLHLKGEVEPDQLPVLVSKKEPFYPLLARRRGWEGTVTLEVRLERDGKIKEVNVVESSGYEALDREAVKAIRGWVYEPANNEGIPIEYRLRVKITFDLEHEAAQN